eukprot:g29047.t2
MEDAEAKEAGGPAQGSMVGECLVSVLDEMQAEASLTAEARSKVLAAFETAFASEMSRLPATSWIRQVHYQDTGTFELWKVARQLHALWVPVLFGSISAGIRTTNLSYLGLNFFAQQHTDLRPEDIRCEDTPEAPYCQAAINDNLFWATTIGAIGSLLHFVLGPFLGALSDSIGRRPVILLCSLLGYPSLVSLALFRSLVIRCREEVLPQKPRCLRLCVERAMNLPQRPSFLEVVFNKGLRSEQRLASTRTEAASPTPCWHYEVEATGLNPHGAPPSVEVQIMDASHVVPMPMGCALLEVDLKESELQEEELQVKMTPCFHPGDSPPMLIVTWQICTDDLPRSVAFGLVSAVALLSTMLGAGIGAFLSMKSGVAAMIFFDMGILLPYLVCCLPETLVPAKRQAMQWRAAAPGLGLSILVRNQLFMQLSTLVIGSTFIGTGFQRVSSSFLQILGEVSCVKYIRWPKHCNNVAIIIGGASSIVWTGFGLSITSKIMGDVGSLGLALWAGAFYMLCFAFITTQWHVYILNAVLLGPQALAFPATSAIKSRLVAESEQGLLQGALNTGKSIAESVGPILFGFLIPILLAFLLSLPLLCLAAMLPQKLASFELQLREQLREQSVQIEMEIFEAEDVSLLDPTQRDKLL